MWNIAGGPERECREAFLKRTEDLLTGGWIGGYMNIIVAVDENWAIGNKGDLLVRIPADHKMFRQETLGKVVVLGRKTLATFPGGLPALRRRTPSWCTAWKSCRQN